MTHFDCFRKECGTVCCALSRIKKGLFPMTCQLLINVGIKTDLKEVIFDKEILKNVLCVLFKL